ncbi:MAG TPA: fatty acid desaturase CarF family protein [Burkholderiaceae bacterium]|nr:fatty acid desaturase CarF family protein [Burkholderiaceae bacterium]
MSFTESPIWIGLGRCQSAILVVLFADFVSGLVHWAIDKYTHVETPFIGRLVACANVEHHRNPRAFVRRTWWQSSWDLVVFSLLFVVVCWWTKTLSWQLAFFASLLANVNQIHKWTHRTPSENGSFITILQRMRLVQSRRHHAQHHRGNAQTRFCVLTDFVNPLLDAVSFWQMLEAIIRKVSGFSPREVV